MGNHIFFPYKIWSLFLIRHTGTSRNTQSILNIDWVPIQGWWSNKKVLRYCDTCIYRQLSLTFSKVVHLILCESFHLLFLLIRVMIQPVDVSSDTWMTHALRGSNVWFTYIILLLWQRNSLWHLSVSASWAPDRWPVICHIIPVTQTLYCHCSPSSTVTVKGSALKPLISPSDTEYWTTDRVCYAGAWEGNPWQSANHWSAFLTGYTQT